MESIRDVASHYSDRQLLIDWNVLVAVDDIGAVVQTDDPAQGADRLRVDDFLLAVFETMARTFFGLHSRSHALWLGGVYKMVRFCAPEKQIRQECAKWAQSLWLRIVAMEHLMAQDHVDDEIWEFAVSFLWHQGIVYRELLILESEGRPNEAEVYAWRIHSSTYHEKGFLNLTIYTYFPRRFDV